MKKRGTRKCTAAELLVSPLPLATPHRSIESDFNLNAFNNKKSVASTSALIHPTPSPPLKTLTTISDLNALASSRLDSIKRHLDLSHSEILKDIEASHSRLHKRFKIQTQACQQVMDETEKEYKKMSERISESREAMKASYAEFIADAQASASRVCKTSIPELLQSFEKAVDVLRSRFGVPSTAV